MLSLTSRTSTTSTSSESGAISPASRSHSLAAGGSASRSTPESASQVLTKDCTTRSGIGAGFVSASGTQEGSAMEPW